MTPFEAMTGRAPSLGGLLAEVHRVYLSRKANAMKAVHSPRIISLSPLSITYVSDVTLGASGLWLGTRAGAGGTATLA